MNKAAQQLGRLSKGVKKNMTEKAIQARRGNLKSAMQSDGMKSYQAKRRAMAKKRD